MSKSEGCVAAIFDLDGVIADTARFHFMAWQQLARELGIYLEPEAEDRLKGLERMASLDVVLGGRRDNFSIEEKEVLANQKNDHYRTLIQTLTPDDLLEGAAGLLEQLKSQGIPIALASASKNAAAVIERLGIADHFTYVADANHVQNPKPHPEIFLNAAQGLGVEPGNCVGIEDAVAGVEAINRAGMRSVGVGDADILVEAHEVIPSLSAFSVPRYFSG